MVQGSKFLNCSLCSALMTAGVSIEEKDCCPAISEELEVFAPGRGHGHQQQLRRCKNCGTIYRYHYVYEYDPTGSSEEYYLWRLTEEAQNFIEPLLGEQTSKVDRNPAFEAALTHKSKGIRLSAALALWIAVDQRLTLKSALAPACEALADSEFLVGHFCYMALLWYMKRSKAKASAVCQAMDAGDIDSQDSRFSSILRKEFQK